MTTTSTAPRRQSTPPLPRHASLRGRIPRLSPAPQHRAFLWSLPGLSALLLLTAITAVQLRFANRVFAGVRVAGVDLSELTREQAAARLQEQLTPFQGPTILSATRTGLAACGRRPGPAGGCTGHSAIAL
ncbi:hypothetical protein [Candidatus Amarolinea dominans]|uniref:hypothetical protein n=1 Tax=Candidatus Amarolinea dominans TaxID=3140696 RepID=UPI001D5407BF|nr:hypothetical protein [Anaerolineae bacterium]